MSFQAQFSTLFASINQAIEIKEDHCNGTGYFDDLATDKEVGTAGERFTFTTGGRKGVVLCCATGNVVIFQRYSNREDIHCYHVVNSRGSAAGNHLKADDTQMFEEAIEAGGDINATLMGVIVARQDAYLASLGK